MKKWIGLLVVLVLCFLPMGTVRAKDSQKHHIEVYYFYNNNPIYSVQVVAKNYALAQEKLMSGTFTKDELGHFSFNNVKENYEVKNGVVKMDDGLTFGKQVTLSKSEANRVIEALYLTNVEFLDYLNEFGAQVTLTNPDNAKYKFSDKNGLSVGDLEEGLTLFVTSVNSRDIVLKEITKDETIFLGNTRNNRNVEVEYSGEKKNKNLSVDYGQSVTYRIPIKTAKQLQIDVSPNFVVESVNYPYQKEYYFGVAKEGKDGQLTGSTSLDIMDDVLGYKSSRYELEKDRNQNISEAISDLQSIYRLTVDVSDKTSDDLLVTGRVASKVDYPLTVRLQNRDNETESVIHETYSVYNSSFKQGILVSENGVYSKSPWLRSYNINFAVFDASTNKLQAGVQYVLGRVDAANKLYLYAGTQSGKAIWQEQEESFNAIKVSQKESYPLFKGNYSYAIDGVKLPFELNKFVWEYNAKEQQKDNSALFKIKGLSSAYTYQLYPVKVPKGYQLANKPVTFSVGKTSQKKAQFSNYLINGQILDMAYGHLEYNALPIVPIGKAKQVPLNPYLLRLMSVLSVFALVTLITVSLLRLK